MSDRELLPIGVALGTFRHDDGATALHVRRGWDVVEVRDPVAAAVWPLLRGEPTMPGRPFGWAELREFAAKRSGQGSGGEVRNGVGSLADDLAVDVAVEELISLGLAWDLDPRAPGALAECSRVRILPLQGVIGPEPGRPGAVRFGLPGQPGVLVTTRAAALWEWAHTVASLGSLAERFAASPPLDRAHPGVDWRSPAGQLPAVLGDLRWLLWYGLAAIDADPVRRPPLPPLPDESARTHASGTDPTSLQGRSWHPASS